MTVQVFTEVPDIDFDRRRRDPIVVYKAAGGGQQQRAATQDRPIWTYLWPMRRTKAEALVIDAFFDARSGGVESFFLKDPWCYARTGISLGTSTAGQTVFKLPTTGQYAGDFPVDDAHVVVKDDGTAVTVSDTDTEDREFTLAAAPTVGSVMTCDYWFYRLVALVDGTYGWGGLGPGYGTNEPQFDEVEE